MSEVKPTPREFVDRYKDLTPMGFRKLDEDTKLKLAVATALCLCEDKKD